MTLDLATVERAIHNRMWTYRYDENGLYQVYANGIDEPLVVNVSSELIAQELVSCHNYTIRIATNLGVDPRPKPRRKKT